MAVANSLQKTTGKQKVGFTAYLTQDAVRDQINKVVGGKNGDRFIASIVSAVQTNPALQECSNSSILAGALLGESLKLSPSPMLGNYYLVPYNDKERGKVAQFQLGYRAYIQMAIRTGQYEKLNVLPIKEGELVKYDPLNEEIEVKLIDDEDEREKAETIGYYAFFKLINGFKKCLYMSRKQVENHAKQYSQSYANDIKNKTKYSYWTKNFDQMACKTLLRRLLGRYGYLSVEMQSAYEADMAVVDENGNNIYVDSRPDDIVDTDATVVEEPKKTKTEPAMNPPEEVNVDNAVQQALFGAE